MKNENAKNNNAATQRIASMRTWNLKADHFERHFSDVIQEAKLSKYFEDLYVSRNRTGRQIQLFAGAHPIGTHEITQDELGRAKSHRVHRENGCSLVISQSAAGNVAIILYPYASEKVNRIESNIIWGVFNSPNHITEKILKKCIKDFFTYIRVSAAVFTPSTLDRWRIDFLIFRGRQYTEGYGLIKLLFSKWLMPTITLVAVVLGANG